MARTKLRKRYALGAVALCVVAALLLSGVMGWLPVGRYMVPQTEYGGPVRLEAEMAGGIRYVVWPAVDVFGRQVVLGHYVERSSAATGTPDPRFFREIVDGRTTLEAASTLMESIADGLWSSRGIRASDLRVPGYLWTSADGAGHFAIDYWELLPSDRRRMTDVGMEQDTLTLDWPRSRIVMMSPGDYQEATW